MAAAFRAPRRRRRGAVRSGTPRFAPAHPSTSPSARLRELEGALRALVAQHDVGRHRITIPDTGAITAACVLAETGDLAHFPDAAALDSYAGLVPALRHPGKRAPARAGCQPAGNVRLRRGLYMATLTAVRYNPWLRTFYERLAARGKPKLLALTAATRKLLTAVHSIARRRRPTLRRPRPGDRRGLTLALARGDGISKASASTLATIVRKDLWARISRPPR